MIIKLFLISTLCMFVNTTMANCRLHTPIIADCKFYTQCLESKFSCGKEGYPLSYGGKYCKRFQSLDTPKAHKGIQLSNQGIVWRDRTLRCLQDDLIIGMEVAKSCSAINEIGFNSHSSCYTLPGSSICDLSAEDLFSIARVVDGIEYFTYNALKQMTEVASTCAPTWLKEKLDAMAH